MISQDQYAVEVKGRGVMGIANNLITDDDLKNKLINTYNNPVDAIDAMLHLRKRYRELGVPEIADTVRAVARTATTIFSDWEPLPLPIGNDK